MKNAKSPYEQMQARIVATERDDYEIRTFRLRLAGGRVMKFMPGQFIQISVPGIGEMPVSPSSAPLKGGDFEVSVRKVGRVSGALFGLKKGDEVGIRGPYGNGYPVERFRGKDIVIAAGGVGVAPLASLADYMSHRRSVYGRISLLYGARSPRDLIFAQKEGMWRKSGIDVLMTVDKADETWDGNVGVVTTLFDKYGVKGDMGVTCGPPIMMKFVLQSFRKIGIKDSNIYLSLERMMQCGVGKCGHCSIGNAHVCTDGPVFRASQLSKLTENALG